MVARQDGRQTLLSFVKKQHKASFFVKKQKKKFVDELEEELDPNDDNAIDQSLDDKLDADVDLEGIGDVDALSLLDDGGEDLGDEDDEELHEVGDDIEENEEDHEDNEDMEEAENDDADDGEVDDDEDAEEAGDDITDFNKRIHFAIENRLTIPEHYSAMSFPERLVHLHRITQSKECQLLQIQDQKLWTLEETIPIKDQNSTQDQPPRKKREPRKNRKIVEENDKKDKKDKKDMSQESAITTFTKDFKNTNFATN